MQSTTWVGCMDVVMLFILTSAWKQPLKSVSRGVVYHVVTHFVRYSRFYGKKKRNWIFINQFYRKHIVCLLLFVQNESFVSSTASGFPSRTQKWGNCHGINSRSFRSKLHEPKQSDAGEQLFGGNLPKMGHCVFLILAALLSVASAQFIPPVSDISA